MRRRRCLWCGCLFGDEWLYKSWDQRSKDWQFASPFDRIHTEVRMRYSMAANRAPGNVAIIDGRYYPDGGSGVGPNLTAYNTLAPRVGTLPFGRRRGRGSLHTSRRLRPARCGGSTVSGLRSADDPVQIYERLQIRPGRGSETGSWESFGSNTTPWWVLQDPIARIGHRSWPTRGTLSCFKESPM